MGFKSTILVVEDVVRSRMLYEELLGCKVEADFGIFNVGFEGGFALYKKSLFAELINSDNIVSKAQNLAVYFEFDDINSVRDKIIGSGFELLHDIKEQPWGQKVFRFYDYDNHILEIAEDMDTVLIQMHKSGMSEAAIAQKTGYTEADVKNILKIITDSQETV
ncbi:VOC family protein [Gorillibacterium sp. sgz500922]|uniref:VOC family protein n=1 Tax=Gorillibacterium sp. sgz500922 TaxID=3446694 RepID=UPI003F67ACCB